MSDEKSWLDQRVPTTVEDIKEFNKWILKSKLEKAFERITFNVSGLDSETQKETVKNLLYKVLEL
jgi:hypothetical protein